LDWCPAPAPVPTGPFEVNPMQQQPESVPLDLTVVYKRCLSQYEEWRIEYAAEGPETWPDPAGQRIPAYLLVPRGKTGPFPAMVCFHQCNIDCDLGKEAVVGKVVDRPAQAYGLELVRQGFVVIAPDVLFCGERNVPEMRKSGDRVACFEDRERFLERPYHVKSTLDNARTVDVLESLDFVDETRIGTMGHSGGSFQALQTLATDARVSAGIVSGRIQDWNGARFRSMAPKLLILLNGLLDGSGEKIAGTTQGLAEAMDEYRAMKAEGNLVVRTHKCGHHIVDDFKWYAYKRLKQHFGMQPLRDALDLRELLRDARRGAWWAWGNDDTRFPPIAADPDDTRVAGDPNLEGALSALFVHLAEKTPAGSCLTVNVARGAGAPVVVCSVRGGDDSVEVAHDDIRYSEQILFENDVSLEREQSDSELRYLLRFPRRAE
jgi:dienelactone hydrolase